MSNILKSELRSIRPKLREVTPLAFITIVTMGVFNIILGILLFFAIDADRLSAPLLLVNDYLTFKIWGVVFIGIGLIKFYALLTNNWSLSRKSLLLGVSIKAAWAVALIIRSLISPGTFFLTLLWLTVATLQISCYIWFMPPILAKADRRRSDIDV